MMTSFTPAAPAAHGFKNYRACVRCNVLRPPDKLEAKGFGATTEGLGCIDGCDPSTTPSHFDPPPPAPAPTGLDVNGDALPVTP